MRLLPLCRQSSLRCGLLAPLHRLSCALCACVCKVAAAVAGQQAFLKACSDRMASVASHQNLRVLSVSAVPQLLL
jgi:hypothetical protein